MSAKHTPGPWDLTKNFNTDNHKDKAYAVRGGLEGWCIAEICNDVDDSVEANARLIAAAPEMLELLQELASALQASSGPMDPARLNDANAWNYPEDHDAHTKARALLARIEGGGA